MALFHEKTHLSSALILKAFKKRAVPVFKDIPGKEVSYKQGVASGRSASLPLIRSRNLSQRPTKH